MNQRWEFPCAGGFRPSLTLSDRWSESEISRFPPIHQTQDSAVAITLPRCLLPVCCAAMYLKFTGCLEELPRDSVHGYPFIMPATSVTACLFLWLFASCMGRKNCCLCSHCTTDSFITGLFCAFRGLGDHFNKRRSRKWSTELFQQLLLLWHVNAQKTRLMTSCLSK